MLAMHTEYYLKTFILQRVAQPGTGGKMRTWSASLVRTLPLRRSAVSILPSAYVPLLLQHKRKQSSDEQYEHDYVHNIH